MLAEQVVNGSSPETAKNMAHNSIVLVVDDEPIGLEVVKALLYDSDYTLHFASNGMEALQKTEELRPDLILLDVLMPGMSGYDVCRRIRALPHLADIPIILLTALNDRDAKIRGIQSGADDFISKPFDRLELSVRVKTILRLNRYRRLKAERAKFAWVVESAEDGYLILNRNDEITYANPQARRLLGLSADEEKEITEKFLDIARRQYQLQPDHAWENWPSPTGETVRHFVRPQSETSSLWLQVECMEGETTVEDSWLVQLRDVTHEVNQQRLRWSFHSQIQHKFRHPLTVLAGHLEILSQDEHTTPAERKMLIDNAHRASRHLSREILSVLDYLTVTAEGAASNDQCRVDQVIDLAERLEAQMPKIHLDLYSSIHTPQLFKLPLSHRQMETILWELFENAQKFHPRQEPTLSVSLKSADTKLYLQIKDDGVCLPPEQLQQVWTPYYQAERYYTGQVPGMGLGLSMIASTIWNLGGSVNALNRADRPGLIIELLIPLIPDRSL